MVVDTRTYIHTYNGRGVPAEASGVRSQRVSEYACGASRLWRGERLASRPPLSPSDRRVATCSALYGYLDASRGVAASGTRYAKKRTLLPVPMNPMNDADDNDVPFLACVPRFSYARGPMAGARRQGALLAPRSRVSLWQPARTVRRCCQLTIREFQATGARPKLCARGACLYNKPLQ